MKHFFFSTIVTILVFVAGCGDGKIPITGSINYEGQVPESGTIAFVADNGAGATYGGPYANGAYSVRVPEGQYVIRITGRKMVPLDTPIPGELGGPPITQREEVIVPNAYGLHSKLQMTVDKSTRTHNFDLKTPEE